MNRITEPSTDLTGTSVLIVEDKFYLAMEIKQHIEGAGGTVLGPCPDAAAGLAQLHRASPDCAIVDINLGHGPSFEVAEALWQRGVPFLFLTGYDVPVIPAELAHIERVEKPANISRVVDAVGRLAPHSRNEVG